MKAGRKEMRKAPCSERLSPKIFWKAPMIRRITVPGHKRGTIENVLVYDFYK